MHTLSFYNLQNKQHISYLDELTREWDYESASNVEDTLRISSCFKLILLLNLSSEIMGCIYYQESIDCIDILYIYILKKFRRKGFAFTLLQDFFELSEKKQLILEVRTNNLGAQKLYEKFGFRKIRNIPHYYKDGEDAKVYIYP